MEVTAAACRGACTSGSHSTGFPLSRAPVPGARPRTPRAMSLSCCTKCCSMAPPLLPGLGSERFRCNIEFFLPTSYSRTKKLGERRNLRWRLGSQKHKENAWQKELEGGINQKWRGQGLVLRRTWGTQEGLGRHYPRLWLARAKNGSRGGMDRTRARLLAMEMQWKCTAWARSR